MRCLGPERAVSYWQSADGSWTRVGLHEMGQTAGHEVHEGDKPPFKDIGFGYIIHNEVTRGVAEPVPGEGIHIHPNRAFRATVAGEVSVEPVAPATS